jgi:hypothetical protein
MGTGIYYTDGYSYTLVAMYPDNDSVGSVMGYSFNMIRVIEDRIFLNVSTNNTGGLMRDKGCLAIYEMKKGWTVVPYTVSATNPSPSTPMYNVSAGALILVGTLGFPTRVFSCFTTNGGSTSNNNINRLSELAAYRTEAIFYLPFGRYTNIKKAVLGLLPSANQPPSNTTDLVSVTVAVATNRRQLNRYTQVSAGTTSSSIVNGSGASLSKQGRVGDEVRMLSGAAAGQRSWITAIANAGTGTETWTISPALSATPAANDYVSINPFKLAETRSFAVNDIPDNIEFDCSGNFGESFYVQVIINSDVPVGVDLSTVDLYGE